MSLFLHKWSTQPKAFGIFHICGIVFAIVFGVIGYYLGKRYTNEKYNRKIEFALSIIGCFLVVAEILKTVFVINVVNNGSFYLANIPFQICDIPAYMLASLYFLKNDKIKNSFLGFITFFGTGSAIFYFAKPAAALNSEYICLSVYSFFWHYALICIGVFCVVSYSLCKKGGIKYVINGYYSWLVCALIALIVNEVNNTINPNSLVDFFYINSRKETFYPLLNMIFNPNPKPYFLYFIAFLIYYGLGGLLVYKLAKLIDK